MATDFTEETAADAVIESIAPSTDPRLKEILTSLVRHLHGFARDVELTVPEWEKAIDFLTRTGQKCDDHRQEFILLSDVLGLSMLTETISNRSGARPGGQSSSEHGGAPAPHTPRPRTPDARSIASDRIERAGVATASTVLGPFHVVESPVRALGDNIDSVGTGTPCVVTGRVVSTDGTPLPHATLDVWQANDEGFYDVQQPDVQGIGNGRGLFTADDNGEFWFRTIVPRYYPIPTDGPVGDLLKATGRHAFRPAHIHFIVAAPGHRDLTTHMFVAGSEYIESDTVFAVKKSLAIDFTPVSAADAEKWHVPATARHADFTITMQPSS
jgi:catechol 1,2-dioxygenase